MDPMTLIALLAPTLMQGVGGFLDDSDEQSMAEQKRQFDLLLPLKQGQTGLQAGGLLAQLLKLQGDTQKDKARAGGALAALGGG